MDILNATEMPGHRGLVVINSLSGFNMVKGKIRHNAFIYFFQRDFVVLIKMFLIVCEGTESRVKSLKKIRT